MAEPGRHAHVPSSADPDEPLLPEDREPRRVRASRRVTVGWSLLFHAVVALVAILLILFYHRRWAESQPPEFVRTFPVRPVLHPATTPPVTNVVADRDANAQSPGPGPQQPHGATKEDREAPRSPPPGEPKPPPEPPEPRKPKMEKPPPPKEARPPRALPPPQEASLLPQEPENASPEDKRRRLSQALRGLGGSGQSGWGDLSSGEGSSGLGTGWGGADFQIESRSDIDWGPWGTKVRNLVKRNWYSIMPVAAKVGMKGVVQVRFAVHRDGRITDYEVLSPAGTPPLDMAVKSALLDLSSPLPPLPIPPDGEESIRITYTFVYNLEDDREMRAWQRQRWREQRAGG